jgi:hypothetical protein
MSNFSGLKLSPPSTLAHKLVWVDGPARSGKTTLCRLIGSLENCELERIEEVIDYVGFLYSFGKIEHDAAVAMLRMFPNVFLYNSLLSRNINFRWRDTSSALRSSHPMKYLRRLFGREHHDALKREGVERAIFQNHTHFQLERINIHFDAHPDALSVIELQRHPASLVHAWWLKGRGGDLCDSPWNIAVCGGTGDNRVHHLAFGCEEEYLKAPPLERILLMLNGAQMRARETYLALSEERRQKVKLIRFEELISAPSDIIDEVAAFLGTRTTNKTSRAISKLKLPWNVSDTKNKKGVTDFKSELTPSCKSLLDEMVDDYNTGWKKAPNT